MNKYVAITTALILPFAIASSVLAGEVEGTGRVRGNGTAEGRMAVQGNGTASGTGIVIYRDQNGEIQRRRGTGEVSGRGIAIGRGTFKGQGAGLGRGTAEGRGAAQRLNR